MSSDRSGRKFLKCLFFVFKNLKYVFNYRVIPLLVVLQASKIVQIHNITKKPAKIYVLSLYNF
jgi:hypothetical protein